MSPSRAARGLLAMAAIAWSRSRPPTPTSWCSRSLDMMASAGLSAEDLHQAASVISGFMLGHVAMLPLAGRVADLRARIPVLVGSLVLFSLGSLVTALAYDLPSPVTGRVIQGRQPGGLLLATLALVADLNAPRKRGLPARAGRRGAGARQRDRPRVRRARSRCRLLRTTPSGSTSPPAWLSPRPSGRRVRTGAPPCGRGWTGWGCCSAGAVIGCLVLALTLP